MSTHHSTIHDCFGHKFAQKLEFGFHARHLHLLAILAQWHREQTERSIHKWSIGCRLTVWYRIGGIIQIFCNKKLLKLKIIGSKLAIKANEQKEPYLVHLFETFVVHRPFRWFRSWRSQQSMTMANGTYRFRSINLNHSVVFRPKPVRKTRVLAPDRYQLHSHIEFQAMLLNVRNPEKK